MKLKQFQKTTFALFIATIMVFSFAINVETASAADCMYLSRSEVIIDYYDYWSHDSDHDWDDYAINIRLQDYYSGAWFEWDNLLFASESVGFDSDYDGPITTTVQLSLIYRESATDIYTVDYVFSEVRDEPTTYKVNYHEMNDYEDYFDISKLGFIEYKVYTAFVEVTFQLHYESPDVCLSPS